MFGKLFGGKGNKGGGKEAAAPSEADYDAWDKRKSDLMEAALGPEHDVVLHAIVGYPLGGPLHTYYYAKGIEGTGIASKELARLGEKSPSNRDYDKYEFVIFSRAPLAIGAVGAMPEKDEKRDFLRGALTHLANYAEQATLNPLETLEFPADFGEPVGGRCFVLDAYRPELFDRDFGLMLVMEVHRDEMNFARTQGTRVLLEKLKAAGAYPYSDPELRASVVAAKN